jgi:hypothetical protein
MFKKVFVDANVILDIFDNSRRFSSYSIKAIDYLLSKNVRLLTSGDLITTIYYVLAKNNKNTAFESVKLAVNYFDLISFSNPEILKTIKLMETDKNYQDFEDALQYILAKINKCDIILSNDSGFVGKDIKILNTGSFCKIYIK